MCSFRSCQTRFEFLSQFRKVRNAFECFVTQVQTCLPKSKCVWPMKINVICTVVRPRFLNWTDVFVDSGDLYWCEMAYVMFLKISDTREDSLNRWMCDAKSWDMIDLRLHTTWLKCALWGFSIPSYAVSGVWERQEPLLLNKWFNCNQELFSAVSSPLLNPLHMHCLSCAVIQMEREREIIRECHLPWSD